VIVDAFGSPTVKARSAEVRHGLRAAGPAEVRHPSSRPGPVPPFDPADPDMAGGRGDQLDVQGRTASRRRESAAVETPVSETEGVPGLPEIVEAENFVINHNLGDVISQSFGATENTFPSVPALLQLRSAIPQCLRPIT
jgi:hypothetical protein